MPLAEVPSFIPAMPEIFLALPAMGLLMVGVFQKDGDVAEKESDELEGQLKAAQKP